MPLENKAIGTLQHAVENSWVPVFVEQYAVWFVVALFLVFMRESVQNVFAGAFVFFGSRYDENMVCYVHVGGQRRPARISKTSLFSTTFYLYNVENGIIQGATLLSVPNSELKHLLIERPLDNLDIKEGAAN